MRRHGITWLFLVGLALVGAPVLAQLDGLGLTEANGCRVFSGTGSGQIVSEWGVYPIVDVGTVQVTDVALGYAYTILFEDMTFPSVPVAEGGVVEHRGFANWHFLENGASGTSRYRMVLTPDDPANPTRLDIVFDGEVVKGTPFTTGGGHFVAAMDYWTGAYTISQFSMVLCLP